MTSTRPQQVAMVDPSLFTIPYDAALCGALEESGCKVTLFGRRLRANETTAFPVTEFFYRHSDHTGKRVFKAAEHAIDVARLCRRLSLSRPDVIHFQWMPLPLVDTAFLPLLKAVAPVVLTVHDITPFNGAGAWIQVIGTQRLLRHVSHLIVHSATSKSTLVARGIDPQRIAVIPHGVLHMRPATVVRDKKRVIVLMFGKVKPYKGIDTMIDALGKLPHGIRDKVVVRVVGEPAMPMQPFHAQARRLGVSRAIEWDSRFVADEEIGAIMAGADIFAFPYRDIDASGVLMACLPHGKPILATAIGAFKTLLRDGEHGYLVGVDDARALAERLTMLIESQTLRDTMGAKVAQLSNNVPSWRSIATTTIATYNHSRRMRMTPLTRDATVG